MTATSETAPNSSCSFSTTAILWGFCCWVLLASTFALAYYAQERTIYYWDNDNYPRTFRLLVRVASSGLSAVLNEVRWSLNIDYNYLPAFLLLPLGLIFGEGRGVFLAGVASIYGFIALAMTLALYRSLSVGQEGLPDRFHSLLLFLCVALMPQFWLPILRGYPDVLGMGVVSGILWLHVSKPLWERPQWQMVVMGSAVAGLLLFRRWYPYFIVASTLAILYDFIWAISSKQPNDSRWSMTRSLATNGAIALGIAGLLLLVLSPQQFVRNLTTSYRDLYAGYRSAEWTTALTTYYQRYLGMTTVLLLGFGLYFSTRLWGLRRLGFIGVYLVSGFLLFQRTQDFGCHQWYGLMPGLCVIFMAGVTGLLSLVHSHRSKMGAAGLVVAVLALQLWTYTTPEISQRMPFLRTVFLTGEFPLVRTDLEEFRRMVNTLAELQAPDEKVYVVASSDTLNAEIIRNATEQWNIGSRLRKDIQFTHEVDSRDGFPRRFFESSLIVVASPVQLHLAPGAQHNVSFLIGKMLHDENFRDRFEHLQPAFALEHHVQVSLYRLKSPFSEVEIWQLLQEYNQKKA